MATIETLILQLFDRKRQIIDERKHKKFLFDQYLASKLLIQGINPPPYLLPANFPPSSRHFSAFAKSDLVSGLSHPQPGFLYDKPVSVVNNIVSNEACGGNFTFSTACDEDGSSVIPVSNVDDIEGRAGIGAPFHVEDADTLNHIPMTPEEQSNGRTCDTQPKLEQSLVKIERSRSRQKALESRKSAKTSGKSRLDITNNVAASSQNKSCQGDQEFCCPKESPDLVRSLSFSTEQKEEALAEIKNPYASGCLLTQFASNEVKEVLPGDHPKREKDTSVNVGGSTELVESDKSPALPTEICTCEEKTRSCAAKKSDDLAIDNTGGCNSANKCFQDDDEVYSIRDSVELVQPCAGSVTLSANNEAKDVHEGDMLEPEMSDSIYSGRITRSRSSSQQFAGVLYGSKRLDDSVQLHGSRGHQQSLKSSVLPARICSSEEPGPGPRMPERSNDASNVTLSIDLGIKNNLAVLSRNNNSQGDEEDNAPSDSLGLVKRCSFPTETCDEEEASIKLTNSTSPCQLFEDVPSSSNACGSSEQPDGSREFLGSYTSSALHSETCDREEACAGPYLIKESCDASDISLIKSVDSKSNEGETRHDRDDKKRKRSTAGGITTLTSGSQLSLSILSNNKNSEDGQKINDNREPVEFVKQTTFPMEIFSEEAETGNTKPEMRHQEEWGSNVMLIMVPGDEHVPAPSLSIDQQCVISGPSDCSSRELEVDIEPGSSERCDDIGGQDVSNLSEHLHASNKAKDCEESPQVKKFKFSVMSPELERMNVDEADQDMPEFERFGVQNFEDEFLHEEIPSLSNIKEHPSSHDHISRPACFSTPGSPYPAAWKSSVPCELFKNSDLQSSVHVQQCSTACLSTPSSPFPDSYNLCLEPGIYSSVPNGCLENIGLRNNLFSVGSILQRKCLSDPFSFTHNQSLMDFKKPFLSPVQKGLEIITSKSGGSEKVKSCNPEHTCFTIIEDSESCEEDDTEAKTNIDEAGLSLKRSSIRDPLCDLTAKNKISLVPDHAVEKKKVECVSTEVGAAVERKSVQSVCTGIEIFEICDIENPSCTGIVAAVEKRSVLCISTEVGVAVEKNNLESVSTEAEVFEICDVQSHASGMSHRQRTQSIQGKENNYFSVGGKSLKKNTKGLSSRFCEQKLAGRASLRIRGQNMSEKEPKRNNIVSSVKSFIPPVRKKQTAATAPVKKDVKVKALEATKYLAGKKENERKQKIEALKQMELAKKLKEEAKKKKERENVVKKGQREEEDKKEKDRKRKRIEGVRCHQKQAQEIIQAWRGELKYGAQVDRIVTTETSTPNFSKTTKPISQNYKEPSYDISPYQGSDDEGDEDDEMSNKKFIPSWASKSCVSLALSYLKHLDPDTIFPPECFSSLDASLL